MRNDETARFSRSEHRSSGRQTSRRGVLAAGAAAVVSLLAPGVYAQTRQLRFKRISTQFIAALAAPEATSGDNAQLWGVWRRDPGPRGVRLDHFAQLQSAKGVAPAGWQFDGKDWWLEEHGLIMEQPEFPLAAGKYLVTGDRDVTTALTVYPPEGDGSQRWELDGATLYDVTHLRCRSARYTPASAQQACSPTAAHASEFPVAPGGVMPAVEHCAKQDYAVLILIGIAESV
jgi:hypothetical protein